MSLAISKSPLVRSNHFWHRNTVVAPVLVLKTSTRSRNQPGRKPLLSCSTRIMASSPGEEELTIGDTQTKSTPTTNNLLIKLSGHWPSKHQKTVINNHPPTHPSMSHPPDLPIPYPSNNHLVSHLASHLNKKTNILNKPGSWVMVTRSPQGYRNKDTTNCHTDKITTQVHNDKITSQHHMTRLLHNITR